MAVNLVSPGVNVREVDLTIGRIDASREMVGAIAGPFERGPVGVPVLIENEQQLLNIFGKPQLADDQYEYWLSASSYLSYGGVLRVIRTDTFPATSGGDLIPSSMTNANATLTGFATDLKITSDEDYSNNHYNDANWSFASRNPGSWANNLKVCVIDNFADQIISGINTTKIIDVGFSTDFTRTNVTIGVATDRLVGIDTTGITLETRINSTTSGSLQFNTTILDINAENGGTIVFTPVSANNAIVTESVNFGSVVEIETPANIQVGYAITQTLNKTSVVGSEIVTYDGFLRGIITEVGNDEISVKLTDRVDSNGVSHPISYKNPGQNLNLNAFSFDTLRSSPLFITDETENTKEYAVEFGNILMDDWYDNQTLGLTNNTIYWKNIAPKPGTSQYCSERSSENDELHLVVVDDTGSVTGISGNILEKYTNLSKAIDAKISPSQSIYYKDFIENSSNYIFVGYPDEGISSGFVVSGVGTDAQLNLTSGPWGTTAQSSKFDVIGSSTFNLRGGKDYSETTLGRYQTNISDLISAYQILNNPAEYGINFLINGPSSGATIYESQAKANALIAIAESRKDCIAVISPHKPGVVEVTDPSRQTSNIIEFFDPLTSSSYAVFDSGYKYTYDRFNNKFTYIPCNSDVAGIMAKTTLNNYSWFSPAGSNRGSLNNVVKLAYNPSKNQRDQIYTKRINPVISSPGAGFILFGDKTALSYASAFDRINVRRLFLTIEETIEKAARAQLFEFNDVITRTNFINIVEPYLRDIRSKRGITEFLVICDETNNTSDIIDSNQFKADIFVKPARSINFIGLTFVATRTGVSFSEVVGTV